MSTRLADATSRVDLGERMHAFVRELYPICRSITGNGTRETLRRIGERIPLEVREVPTGTTGVRLDRSSRMEHQGRLRPQFVRGQGDRFREVEPARAELQHTDTRADVAGRAAGAPVQRTRASRVDSVQDVVLQGQLGLLSEPQPARVAAGRSLRGRRRFVAGGWPPQLRRMPDSGGDDRRSAAVVPRLPSFAVQRQPVGHRAVHVSRRPRCSAGDRVIRTASFSFPARSAQSPGSR